MNIRIPGRVWLDALDPQASGMQADLGLPQPRVRRKGRGVSAYYDDVTPEVARELADYLCDRADTQSSQSYLEPAERELYWTMRKTGLVIREAAGEVATPSRPPPH